MNNWYWDETTEEIREEHDGGNVVVECCVGYASSRQDADQQITAIRERVAMQEAEEEARLGN